MARISRDLFRSCGILSSPGLRRPGADVDALIQGAMRAKVATGAAGKFRYVRLYLTAHAYRPLKNISIKRVLVSEEMSSTTQW